MYLGVLYGVRDVAIKVINNPDAKQQARFVREIMMLKACHDPNIVQFLGAAIDKEQTLLVMTYMSGGDLLHQIRNDREGNFRWHQRYVLQEISPLQCHQNLEHTKRLYKCDPRSLSLLPVASLEGGEIEEDSWIEPLSFSLRWGLAIPGQLFASSGKSNHSERVEMLLPLSSL